MPSPWMKFYVADYLADTSHLTTLEHGAYMLLIMHYWRTGGLPGDSVKLARIARMPVREWQSIENTMAELFLPGWKHKRIDSELEKARDKSEKAQASVNARWSAYERKSDVMQTNVKRNTYQSQSQNQSKESISGTPAKRARSFDLEHPRFEEFWTAYPKRQGSNPRQPASQKFSRYAVAGVDPAEMISGAARYRDACERDGTEPRFVAQAVTWLNQQRWKDYGAPDVALADGSKLPAFANDAEFEAWWQKRMAGNG